MNKILSKVTLALLLLSLGFNLVNTGLESKYGVIDQYHIPLPIVNIGISIKRDDKNIHINIFNKHFKVPIIIDVLTPC